MATKFWRFAYEEASLEEIVRSNALPFPDFARYPYAKNNSAAKVRGDLRAGNFVLLANFDHTRSTGKITAVGRVENILPDSVHMTWRKLSRDKTVEPNPQGGIAQWQKEAVFRFDAGPAKRHDLAAIIRKLFP
jgi:hypothetical protein